MLAALVATNSWMNGRAAAAGKGPLGSPVVLSAGLRQPGPSGREAGGTAQFRVARKVGLDGRSARTEWLVSNLRGSMNTPGRRVPCRLLCRDREPSIGNGSVDPVRAKLSDVTSVIRVTIVVIHGRPEREIGGNTGDRHREHEEEANSKNRSDSPRHARMIARGPTLGCAIPAPLAERG